MRKQKRRGLALMLAFVMLVSLVYVPGATFTTFAEDIQQTGTPAVEIPVQPPAEVSKSVQAMVVEEESDPEEQALLEFEERKANIADEIEGPEDQDGAVSMRTTAASDRNGINTPAGGEYFVGETLYVKSDSSFAYYYSSLYHKTSHGWYRYINTVYGTDDSLTVEQDAAVESEGWSRSDGWEYDLDFYTFILPPSIENLVLQSRTKNSVTVGWENPNGAYEFDVYVDGVKETVSQCNYTVGHIAEIGGTVEISVVARYLGRADSSQSFDSVKVTKQFKAADFIVVATSSDPENAPVKAPAITYHDDKTPLDYVTVQAIPKTGFHIDTWNVGVTEESVSGSKTLGAVVMDVFTAATPIEKSVSGNMHKFEVNSDKYAKAIVSRNVHEVTIAADPNYCGTVNATVAKKSPGVMKDVDHYEFGTVLNLSAQPNRGYKLLEWRVDGEALDGNNYIVEDEDVAITGVFIKEPVGLVKDKLTLMNFTPNGGDKVVTFVEYGQANVQTIQTEDAPADRLLMGEVTQTVPYKTTVRDLVYKVKLQPDANSIVEIKDGATFGDLVNATNSNKDITFSVFNDESHTMIQCDSQSLDKEVVHGGRYVIELKVHNTFDKYFNEDEQGEEIYDYTNEVVVYQLAITANVQKPCVEITVDVGGAVSHSVERPIAAAAEMEVMTSKWPLIGQRTETFYWNEETVQILTATTPNTDAHRFVEWQYRVRGTDEWSTFIPSDGEAGNVLRLTMNNNYEVRAVYEWVKYTVIQSSEITDQGKILYKICTDNSLPTASVFSSDQGWRDLPTTVDIHYGDRVMLKAKPSVAWLFKEWIWKEDSDGNWSEKSIKTMFENGAVAVFTVDEEMMFQFPSRVMTANAEFMSNYGFADYVVTGVKIENFKGLKPGPLKSTERAEKRDYDMSFDYHVEYGTSLADAIESAKFDTHFVKVNSTNEVQLLGRYQPKETQDIAAASIKSNFVVVTESPSVVQIEEIGGKTFNPFFIRDSIGRKGLKENTFEYRYRVTQYPSIPQNDEGSILDSKKINERPLYKEYVVRVSVIVDEPLLAVDVPIGGYVNLVAQENADSVHPASDSVSPPESTPVKLTTKIHKLTFDVGTRIGLTAVADAGYTFSGWTTGDGYPVNSNSFIMDNNYNVKPIFTANPTVRRNRNNNNTTPQQEIAQILDETTPLGILYRQLFVGYPNGDLRMFDTITRGQLSLILQRAQQYDVSNPPSLPVADAMEEWYRKEALTALGKGYLTLRSGNIFAGNDAVTGSELVDALNKAFGSNLTLEEAYHLANGVSSEQVAKILMTNATDFQLATSGMIPLGVGSFDADKPVPRETVARIIYAVLYPQAPTAPEVPVVPANPQ